jgi:hypothetical protein
LSQALAYTSLAKLAAWLSGKPYSPKPLICRKQSSANGNSYPARDHAADELVVEHVDAVGPPPRRHRPPELVRLDRREPRRDDGQPHRLLLEQWHAERLAKDLLQFRFRKGNGFLVVPAPQVGMNHVPWMGPRPDDGDSITRSKNFCGLSRGSIDICARDST